TSGYVWGVALDITFKDVSINWDAATQGGRPRLAYEAETYGGEGQTYYTSGNTPANPPTGALTAPLSKTYQTNPLMTVSGWGQDDIAVTKLEILARYDDGDWITIDEQTTTPFTAQVDLCNTDIPDGTFDLALRVWDYEGNPSSILSVREVIKGVECTAGVDPDVTLNKIDGSVLLGRSSEVSATVTKGSTNSNIASVSFWFHGTNWNGDDWVLLGTDTNGADGWQAPFEAGSLGESTAYTILAIASDALGNQGTDLTFNATLDKTSPWMNLEPLLTPYVGDHYHLEWEVGDALSGFEHMDLYYRADGGDWQLLESNIPTSVTSYDYDVPGAIYVEFRFMVYDNAGNLGIHGVAAAKEGYELIYNLPIFYR
ncbi:MAG: hypothetical protein H0S82_02055, partial [Anaerolineaceae bacterium]|nr:hypothetical protein [Anaerolineaceae bacterium]